MSRRRLTPRSLENAALFHLRRYSCTVEGLRRVLMRKVDRALRETPGDRQVAEGWVEALLQRLSQHGYLDDERYAKSRAEALLRRGLATRHIQQRLRQKGVSSDLAQESVRGLAEGGESPDWLAAVAYARRRRLGPFRRGAEAALDRSARAKALASMARAGFSYALAVKVVDAPDEAALGALTPEGGVSSVQVLIEPDL